MRIGVEAALVDGVLVRGAVDVEVRDGADRRPYGVLAGTVLTIPAAIRKLLECGAGLGAAVATATSVPAQAARRDDVGSLRPGSPADVVVLEGDVEVSRVLVVGVER